MKHTYILLLSVLVACNAPQENRNLKAMQDVQDDRALLVKRMERTTDPKGLDSISKQLDILNARFDSLQAEQKKLR